MGVWLCKHAPHPGVYTVVLAHADILPVSPPISGAVAFGTPLRRVKSPQCRPRHQCVLIHVCGVMYICVMRVL